MLIDFKAFKTTRYFFIYLILELYSKCTRQGSRLKQSIFQSV